MKLKIIFVFKYKVCVNFERIKVSVFYLFILLVWFLKVIEFVICGEKFLIEYNEVLE